MRKNKRALIWLGVAVVVLAALATAYWYIIVRPELELRKNAQRFQIALEQYWNDRDYSYPSDINLLLVDKYLADWPSNPFASGQMQPLAELSRPKPGSFAYERVGPKILTCPKAWFGPDYGQEGELKIETYGYKMTLYGRWHNEYLDTPPSTDPFK